MIRATPKSEMTTDHLGGRGRIPVAQRQHSLAVVIGMCQHILKRGSAIRLAVGKDMSLATGDHDQVTAVQAQRASAFESYMTLPLDYQVETGGTRQIRHRYTPGGREVGAKIQGAFQVQGVENVVQSIHARVLPL